MADYSDKELLSIFEKEDTRHYGFNLIVNIYKERLYRYIRRMVINHDDADDLLQEVYIKVWKGLPNFRQESSLYTWLYRIATNECITFLNNKKRKYFIPISNTGKDLLRGLESDTWFDGDALKKKLHAAILTLPEKQRLVFNLRYFEEMPYETMSQVLGTSVGALKASYHHAVSKIEKIITGH